MVGARGRAPRGDSAVRHPGKKPPEGAEIPFIRFFPENFSNRACNPL